MSTRKQEPQDVHRKHGHGGYENQLPQASVSHLWQIYTFTPPHFAHSRGTAAKCFLDRMGARNKFI